MLVELTSLRMEKPSVCGHGFSHGGGRKGSRAMEVEEPDTGECYGQTGTDTLRFDVEQARLTLAHSNIMTYRIQLMAPHDKLMLAVHRVC
ncbi:hypothetical protein MPTK2_1g11780 [Marchantia polymorpha subsp. ruderalis]